MEWEVLEYENKERPQDWYWAVAVIVASLAIAAFIFVNLILTIFILIGGATLTFFVFREPDMLRVSIDDRGVAVNGQLYPFPVFDSFWVEDAENPPLIILKSEQVYSPIILIPIAEDIDPHDVREALVEYLDEEEMAVPTSRKILEFFGF